MRCALPPACSMHPPVRIMHSSPRRLVLHARGLSCLRPTFPYLATAARRSLATSAVRGEVAPHGAGGKAPPPRHTAHPGWDRRQSDDEDSAHENSLKTFFNSSGFETAAGASAGVLLLGLAAMGYNKWYKSQVLRKMDKAFEGGYDPILSLSEASEESDPSRSHISPARPEQELVDSIVRGQEGGRYFLFMGPKGTGKSSMFIKAMAETQAEGSAYFEAHRDVTVALDRFSESINFSMNRDYLGSLLGLGDPSGTTTMQALERALHKLEQALIIRRAREKRPAVIIMSAAHLLPDDEEGHALLRAFQQRAERWAATGAATFVFLSDDYRCYKILRKSACRMDVVSVRDLTREQSHNVLRTMRKAYHRDGDTLSVSELDQVYRLTGGRLSILDSVARRKNMLTAAHRLIENEKQWLLSITGIIQDHDDDVMDEQKWSTCSWLLFTDLAKRHAHLEKVQQEEGPMPSELKDDSTGFFPLDEEAPQTQPRLESSTDKGEQGSEPQVNSKELELSHPADSEDAWRWEAPNPSIPWGQVRQIMTRPDYVEQLDHLNVIHINRAHHVTADSLPLLHAFRSVLFGEEDFEGRLEEVMDRVSAIESLGRTRELVWKEQGDKGKFLIRSDAKGREVESWTLLGGDERLGRETEDDQTDGL